MGCDIHGWIEKKHNGKWIAVRNIEDDYEFPTASRNYKRFARLASVKGESDRKPLGVPNDVSDTTRYWIDIWNGDGHSHSYMSLNDAAKIFLETDYRPDGYKTQFPINEYFLDFYDDSDDYRLVFWFDN